MKGLESGSYEEKLSELRLFIPEKRFRGDFITLHNCLTGGCSLVGISLFSQATRDRVKGNGLKLHQRRLKLDIRKKQIVKHWNRLPREVDGGTTSPGGVQKITRHSTSWSAGGDEPKICTNNLKDLF